MVPNSFAYAVLYLWPVVAGLGFRALPLNRAIIGSCLAGFLLLPSNVVIELPGLPDIDKESVVLIGILLTYFTHRRPKPVKSIPVLSAVLMVVLLISTFGTILTNTDLVENPTRYIPGLTMYDALGIIFINFLTISAIVVGARALSQAEDHREMLLLIGAAMVLYSLPVLLEIRLSPQLHRWIYGMHPAGFEQQMRGGGFRSTVFTPHGLVLAWLLAVATTALMALRRSGARVFGVRPQILCAYLWVVLLLQKSLGALLLGSLMNLAVLMRPRRQVGLAAAVALIFLTYPVVRGAGLVPVEWINRTVAEYSSERAGSFGTRIFNEDQLLDKAGERPWFGWGGWGRNRLYDPESGRDMSITDGTWIIVLGRFGWVGYLAQFGLICLPLLGLYRHRRQIPFETAALAVILSGNLIDLIPNSSITPITWLMAGALTGTLAAARSGITSAGTVKSDDWPMKMKPALEGATNGSLPIIS